MPQSRLLGALLLGALLATSAPTALAQSSTDDPRVGLSAGLFDAGEAIWNLRLLSATPPPEAFVGVTNSDLAFTGDYAIQGNYNGFIVWDLSDPSSPTLVTEYLCPASQSDVSVFRNLLFVSGEGLEGRLDCADTGVQTAASPDRLRGIRIFDISDIRNPAYVGNVQTCRGSHTHSVLDHPGDDENVYVYVSGSSSIRPEAELPGCSAAMPEDDPDSARFRIEVIRVPLADPGSAEIVSSPRIFEGLMAPPAHGMTPADRANMEAARARGAFTVRMNGEDTLVPDEITAQILQQISTARGGDGTPTAADSAFLRENLQNIAEQQFGINPEAPEPGPRSGPDQCHDITLYPEIGLAGGACEGYGILLDISDPANPTRVQAVADSNFAYWHSATFNNDGTAVLFTDEWGGGGQPKCRASDPNEWGANAIFRLEGSTPEEREMQFASYYKLPAAQTEQENCVAHNGSLIPIPGRDVMVQAWYQGGISIFDWTDPANAFEIAYHDRGPVSPERMQMGGSWSVYWYNGVIVSSEIARGLDVFELTPSDFLSENEIAAANTVVLSELNPQGQPQYEWPATFVLAHAYLDQLERSGGLDAAQLEATRAALQSAEGASGAMRAESLQTIARSLATAAEGSSDASKVAMLADAVRALAG